MNDSRTVLMTLALAALLSTSLFAQVDGKEWLMKAQFAEFSGDLAEAKSCLETVIATDDKANSAYARLRLAALYRRQGDEAQVRKVLEPLMSLMDSIGASARRMINGDRPAATDRSPSPIHRLISVLDQGDMNVDLQVQAAMSSLRTLGALVLPDMIERFDGLGIFGRRNAVEFLVKYDSDPGVRLLLENVIREDRSGEAKLVLVLIHSESNDQNLLISLADLGFNSSDAAARGQAFYVLAGILQHGGDARLIDRCREYFDGILRTAIAANGEGRYAEVADNYLGNQLFSDRPLWEDYLELRVRHTVNGKASRYWLNRLGADKNERLDAMLTTLKGSAYGALLQANANAAEPIVSGLKAGLSYGNGIQNLCLRKCLELGIALSQEDWAAVTAAKSSSFENASRAFERLGAGLDDNALGRARVLLEEESSALSAMLYMATVAPQEVIEHLDRILEEKRRKQVLFDYLVEEPDTNKAKIAIAILSKGGHYDYRLLTTISAGSSRQELSQLLGLVTAPCTSIDRGCIQVVTEAVAVALNRVAKHEDFSTLLQAQETVITHSRYIVTDRLQDLVQSEDLKMIEEALHDCMAETEEALNRTGSKTAQRSFGDEQWRSETADVWDRGRTLIGLLFRTGVEAQSAIEDFAFGSAHEYFRSYAMDCVKSFDEASQRRIYERALKLSDFKLLEIVAESGLMIKDAELRQLMISALLEAPRNLKTASFLDSLPEQEKRDTCVKLLQSSPLLQIRTVTEDNLAQRAFHALKPIKDEELIPLYVEFLETSFARFAIENLGGLYSKKTVPILIESLKSEDPFVQRSARTWLETLETHFSEQKRWQKLLEETQEDAK